MASYHCSVSVGGKGAASSASNYIAREGNYQDNGKNRYEDLEAKAHGNMPKWAENNPQKFWQAADQFERVNGAACRKIEIALPRELNPEQRKQLVEDFIQQELKGKHAYQYAIHCPKAAIEGKEQPHAHIMYSERTLDNIERDPERYFKRYNAKSPEKGGCQKDSAGTLERLQETRQRWAEVQNQHLAKHGHTVRVDHRTLAEQNIDRQPEKHLGHVGVSQLTSEQKQNILQYRSLEKERIEIDRELKPHLAERAANEVEARKQAKELAPIVLEGIKSVRANYETQKIADVRTLNQVISRGVTDIRVDFEEQQRQRKSAILEQHRQQEEALAKQREQQERQRAEDLAKRKEKSRGRDFSR